MKKRIPTFLAGMLTTALIGSLGVGALAATGALTIEVNPINVQVNGETFQPKDAQGNSVPVFTYNGTTYAPLRALAEAYGLEVGYDAGKNMATVVEVGSDSPTTPDITAGNKLSQISSYEDFVSLWAEPQNDSSGSQQVCRFNVRDLYTESDAVKLLNTLSDAVLKKYAIKLFEENYYLGSNFQAGVSYSSVPESQILGQPEAKTYISFSSKVGGSSFDGYVERNGNSIRFTEIS